MLVPALLLGLVFNKITVEVTSADAELKTTFEAHAAHAEKAIEQFFGRPFSKPVVVKICPSRKAFDEALNKEWGMEATQPWMVGAGGSRALFVLSPRVWKTEAQDHDPADHQEIADLVTHELVHSYHAQASPSKDLEGLDELGWFAEGLATYVSGQLEHGRGGLVKSELEAGRGPKDLASAWSGRARYGVSGSMVKFVDSKFGRKSILDLLSVTTNADAMRSLKTNESAFLAAWQSWVLSGS